MLQASGAWIRHFNVDRKKRGMKGGEKSFI